MVVNYRGGSYSRAGTAFVGFSKQTGREVPPRLIPYQFSLSQGLALEFGDFYMRVISNGAFVTTHPLAITGITQANPAVVTVTGYSILSATANNSGVTSSYDPGEAITIAGGSFVTPGVLTVASTTVLSLTVGVRGANTPGTGYAPADTITLAGGTQTSPVGVTVATTRVLAAAVVAGGTGGTNGTQTVTGTTGTGTKFQASVTIAGNAITAVLSILVAGVYSVNPTSLASEPVTGAGLTGARLSLATGIDTFTLTTPGALTANPPGFSFTQGATSGSGIGVTFVSALMGINALLVSNSGLYAVAPFNPAAQDSTSSNGFGATYSLSFSAVTPAFATGDWAFIENIVGMTELNQGTYIMTQISANTYSLSDVYGAPVDSTGFSAYTAGGTAAAIYTMPTIYAEADLKYLKFTQSADVMSLTCVNQETAAEYPPQDLSRFSDTDWSFSVVDSAPTIAPPSGYLTIVASGAGNVYYQYVVTSVNPADGTESIASAIGGTGAAVDIATTQGSITISWNDVANAHQFNIYKASPSYDTPVPTGALFGYCGTAYGTRFVDSNIVPDFTQVPPKHKNPFARGQIIDALSTSAGANYTGATATVFSATGTGAILTPVVATTLTPGLGPETVGPGIVSQVLIDDNGENYKKGDIVVITGDGYGASFVLSIGPNTGTYPGVCSYFQQRRVYAYTLNNPDTYFMSQPGSYTNFDSRIPTISTDAIIGTPWALQVNGVQWMLPTPPGLLVMTGSAAWLLAGVGSFASNVQAITPSSQDAIPQAFSGCSATVPPQKINYSVLYVDAKGSLYYELPYQLYALSEPIDLTENATHLFTNRKVLEHAWCETPAKVLWSARDDGVLLSLTYLKAQQVAGWARHDTQGYFKSVCTITEPPVDALYAAVERFPGTKTAYMIERMDNRLWNSAEDCWCVDSGLTLGQPAPAASITASSATGLGSISGIVGLVGGFNYSAATVVTIVDDDGEGPGVGAVATPTIVAGVITAIAVTPGSVYEFPRVVIYDPENLGYGASAECVLDNGAFFSASAPVFVPADVGSTLRMGGGIATVTSFVSATEVTANILSPIVDLIPNSQTPRVQAAGRWTLSKPVTQISGLRHLSGATVTGLADGNVITPRVVDANGRITLDAPASAVTVGLGFTAQLQSLYADVGEPTAQGQRKKVAAVTARVEASRGFQIGANQPDGSVQSPTQLAPKWGLGGTLADAPDLANRPFNALAQPLFTGDVRIPLTGGFDTKGQVAVQQSQPLPLQILAFINEDFPGDSPEVKASPKQRSRGRGG